MEGIPEDMWSPFKHLNRTLQIALSHPTGSPLDLQTYLNKYKHYLENPLRNPPKSESARAQLKKVISEGLTISGPKQKIHVSKDLINEAFILSDMFNLDEYVAVELLCSAQRRLSNHPGLPRGLIAVLLYYDGRKALACSLRDLFQTTSGISWSTDLPNDVIKLVSLFTKKLVEESNILSKILDLLDELNIANDMQILITNRALGSKKHQNEILILFEEIRLALAMTVFNWSAQCGLSKPNVLRLMKSLSATNNLDSTGLFDDVTLTLLIALLYSFDTSSLQRLEESSLTDINLPILNDVDFGAAIYNALNSGQYFENNMIGSIVKFSFGLTLASLRHAPPSIQNIVGRIIDHDESLVDDAISKHVLEYIYRSALEKDLIYRTDFFMRRLHMVFTDFIDFMHAKVTELRSSADETSRTIIKFMNEGLEPPLTLDRNFEYLMLCISKLYSSNRTELSLCVDYWGPEETPTGFGKLSTRSVSLFKFIRLAGELLPKTLFVPYLTMIAGLTNCERSARCAFNLFKQTICYSRNVTLSWEHFFSSIRNYYTTLRQETVQSSDNIYRSVPFAHAISPNELEGLKAVLHLIRAVCTHDASSRLLICENASWTPVPILFGLLSCSVPLDLKAEILQTLTSIAGSEETSEAIWKILEDSQIIPTQTKLVNYTKSSLPMEIEQSECRLETYGITKGVLDLFYALCSTNMPIKLRISAQSPNYETYIRFLLNNIFLKFYNRNYKNSTEKWEIGSKCLKLFHFFLSKYEPNPLDFTEKSDRIQHPGYILMLQLQIKSELLRYILLMIEEVRYKLEEYSKFRGKEVLEECALDCLTFLETGLSKQNSFFVAHSATKSSIQLFGLNRILLDVNPRTRQPDFALIVAKYITFNSWLPNHALMAIKILDYISGIPNVHAQIMSVLNQGETLKYEIRQGFVECLELEIPLSESTTTVDTVEHNGARIELDIKKAIIELIQNNINQPLPNLVYFLLGFDVQRDFVLSEKLPQTSLEIGNNCIKSLVSLVDDHIELKKAMNVYCERAEMIAERVWKLLYTLCSSRRTSESLLRYFRVFREDFLARYLKMMPFMHNTEPPVVNQMANVLRCIAIELKITANNGQISRFQNLCNLLTEVSAKDFVSEDLPIEISNYSNGNSPAVFEDVNFTINTTDETSNLHLCKLLDCIKLNKPAPNLPELEFFDTEALMNLIKECEQEAGRNNQQKTINVTKLYQILMDELNTVHGTMSTGQRKVVIKEIGELLLYAGQLNDERKYRSASIDYMTAWCIVTQILFEVAPDSAMSASVRKQFIIEVVERILNKSEEMQLFVEISILATDTILLLLGNLRECFRVTQQTSVVETERGQKNYCSLNNINIPNMRYILKTIIEWVMVSDVSSQRVRINLYSALLYCLHIVMRRCQDDTKDCAYIKNYVPCLDAASNKIQIKKMNAFEKEENDGQLNIAVEVINCFGDRFLDTLCNDTISGHDVCKMLALSCIDLVIELHAIPGLVNFIATHGYLKYIFNSLQKSDEDLIRIINNTTKNAKSLYIYESKITFFLRLASTRAGAELLLSEKLLSMFSEMKVFDNHPDLRESQVTTQSINNDRFRQILIPALCLCDCLLTTLGSDNISVSTQILNFLIAHCEMYEIVLRAATPYVDVGLMQELSAITGIIARATTRDLFTTDAENQILKLTFGRLHNQIMHAFNKFILSDSIFDELLGPNNVREQCGGGRVENKKANIRIFIEIAANLSLYCRNVICNSYLDNCSNRRLLTTMLCSPIRKSPNGKFKLIDNIIILIDQLKGSIECYLTKDNLSTDIIEDSTDVANISNDTNANQTIYLIQRNNNKKSEMDLCAFIAEQNLYLLYVYLDCYLRRFYSSNAEGKTIIMDNVYEDQPDVTVTFEEIVTIRKMLVCVFNETFCKQLLLVNDKDDFVEVILRRIKSIVQFVPAATCGPEFNF